MRPSIEIKTYGSLQQSAKNTGTRLQNLDQDFQMPVADILRRLGIPKDNVQLVMLNHCAVSLDAHVHPGDRLALFPQEYPIFSDWKDYRMLENKPRT